MNMSIILLINIIVSTVLIERIICWINPLHPKAVTRFKDLESFYLTIREQNPLSNEMDQLKIESGSSFCQTLFEAPYFQTRLEHYQGTNSKKTIIELMKYQRDTLVKFYENCGRSGFFAVILGPSCVYKHKLKKQTVSIARTRVADFMHMCLVREEQTQTIKQYFISRPYQLRQDDDKYYNIAFLFAYNLNEELVVSALIEDTAVDYVKPSREKIKRLATEYLWLKKIPDEKLSIEDKELYVLENNIDNKSRMCQLSDNAKLRLCATVMNMPIYAKGYTFWPGKFNVEYTCQERQLHFSMGMNHGQPVHKEWTMGCKVRTQLTGKLTTFYMSQNRQCDTTVLVYNKKINLEDIILWGASTHVTVLY